MITYLSLDDVLFLHTKLIEKSKGKQGIRDISFLESAINTPLQTFDSNDFYYGVVNKIVRISFELVKNHTFIDGNKRIGLCILDVLLSLNGFELKANDNQIIDEFLNLAAGKIEYDSFYLWVIENIEYTEK